MTAKLVDPQAYPELLAAKCAEVQALLAPFDLPPPTIVPSRPSGYRMRAEFRAWHAGERLFYAMFPPGESNNPIEITDFPVACATIQALMPRLLVRLQTGELRRRLFRVEFLSTLAGDTCVTLIYHRKLDDAWEAEAAALAEALEISIVGRSRRQKLVVGRDYVTERLVIDGRAYHYRQYEQAFSQPNAEVNTKMIEWACAAARELDGDLLELYCGNGNFSLPLAAHFDHVIATEVARDSTRAALHNLEANAVTNVELVRLSAEEVTQALAGVREFKRLAGLPRPLGSFDLRTVFVDPPRAGLDDATLAMVSAYDTIIYISCNPKTLAANLRSLSETHEGVRFALFDQFPYTEHMECGVVARRRR
ncbi:tRNA (uridine(54)-C5)-methyltransferase TrmA [Pseudenhygromyxa sp. WMMC2535]|uniref:tRNA (uridine(54)-C5)-methyltransferase TrmA n=1 Tax=Pseudenhygromyxa sp. WMMC2535 TaxID=2712867 RepID=UPI001557EC8B|nr:tRNA (uridine(54)-C5)-methyltransferase TrmA [Pseudenhygromyxa sp. WMMC2535]NVB39769.1 tRNA (uridine(54)-C5)-methyltransferase TrmA [Pseudenhygromyxa sp. WMMC2535]